MKQYTGITSETPLHLHLGSGAYYKNYNIATDTPETARAKLLGATSGGGEFKTKPTFRNIEADGAHGNVKGLTVLESTEVSLAATFLETTVPVLQAALIASDAEVIVGGNLDGYTKITGRNDLADGDYTDNVTYIGSISGSNLPLIVQIFNGLGTDGLSMKTKDKGEGTTAITFTAYGDVIDPATGLENIDQLNKPPYAIYYPPINLNATIPDLTATSTVDDGAAGINPQAALSVSFNRKLDTATVNPANVLLATAAGVPVECTFALDAAGLVLTITPVEPLAAATAYLLILTAGVRDRYGVYLKAPLMVNFTTA